MAKDKDDNQRAVPTSRMGRFGRMARMAGGVAGGMLAEGGRQLRAGKRLRARDMLLTPANARRVAEQLATMRGAAMKVGQILSMDSGDFLPKELADILGRLRSDARYMPETQLEEVMTQAYGEGWNDLFNEFEAKPLAAASIGQVHRALSLDDRDIVLKVQYPGVAASIDSDVDNIATLLRVTGLLPRGLDIQPLLEDAKQQLKDEADYRLEADFLDAFGGLLADDERFLVPQLLPELTRTTVLAMSYVGGEPIESIAQLPQEECDRVMTALVDLMFMELFELRMVQTDPNFANYQYLASDDEGEAHGKVVLLDFGATRRFKASFANNYRSLAKAAIKSNDKRLLSAAQRIGYAVGDEDSDYRELVLSLFKLALEPLMEDAPYDFAGSNMTARMSEMAESVTEYRDFWQAPPTDAVFFHRKLGGMFMLATRLKARVNVYESINRWL